MVYTCINSRYKYSTLSTSVSINIFERFGEHKLQDTGLRFPVGLYNSINSRNILVLFGAVIYMSKSTTMCCTQQATSKYILENKFYFVVYISHVVFNKQL